jgi:uncharacterized protein with beta-barrel porin domain
MNQRGKTMSEGNGFVSREAFLSKRQRQVMVVDTSAGKIRVQALSAYERGKLEALFTTKTGERRMERMAKLREFVAVASCVDESGNRMFTEGDVDALGQVESSVLEAVLKAYQELNGSDDADIEKLVGN